jgi:hypothetical protein
MKTRHVENVPPQKTDDAFVEAMKKKIPSRLKARNAADASLPS